MSNIMLWLAVGFLGQALFTARFLIQWLVSEKRRASVVPTAFWWLSLLGGTALLAYAIFRRDPVIITGQSMGLFVYTRNLMLVAKARARRSQTHSKLTADVLVPHYPHAVTPKRAQPASDIRHLVGSPAK
jgi:lipid-A-disaccharide synthase-like uncharacterized protein